MPTVPRDGDPRPKAPAGPAWVLWSDSVWVAVVVLGLVLVARGMA